MVETYRRQTSLDPLSLVAKERLWRENIPHQICIRHFVLCFLDKTKRNWFATKHLWISERKQKKCSRFLIVQCGRDSKSKICYSNKYIVLFGGKVLVSDILVASSCAVCCVDFSIGAKFLQIIRKWESKGPSTFDFHIF